MPVRTEEKIAASAPDKREPEGRDERSPQIPRRALWIGVGVATLVAVVAGVAFILAPNWPFTREALIRSLEQDSQGKVEIGSVREMYFPHPGCVAENVVIRRDASSPRLTIHRVTILGSYLGMLHRYIPRVVAEGAVLSVPPGQFEELFASRTEQQPTNTSVGEIDADDAQIVVATDDKDHPLDFAFHKLKLKGIAKDSAVDFVAALQTPEPTGDLQLQGQIGPFQRDQAGSTPLSGTYSYKNAKLEEFIGVGGVLSSEGKFNGQLQAINVDGTTDTPDFQLDVGIHPVELKTKFHAIVDGTNGDLRLDPIESSWGKTTVVWRGTIQGQSEAKKLKTVALDMTCSSGRVQDLLQLFVHDEQSPMSGAITFHGHTTILPGPEPFLHKLRLEAEFAIEGGRYTNPHTQQEVDILSARARGQADKIEDDQDRDKSHGTNTVGRDLQPVVSSFKGKATLRNGIANFSDLAFAVPGATAQLNGSYGLLSRKIDAQGTAHMETKLSGATTGVKSFVLKVAGALKPHHGEKGSTVMVHVTGTYGHPSFSVQPMKGGT